MHDVIQHLHDLLKFGSVVLAAAFVRLELFACLLQSPRQVTVRSILGQLW